MRRSTLLPSALLVACAGGCASAAPRPRVGDVPSVADLVVHNAKIHTVDAAGSRATALAVLGDRLVHVGDDRGATRWVGPRTRVVDARGRLILPGFHDTHVHLSLAASQRSWCDLGYPSSLAETIERLEACAARISAPRWILASNANSTVFPLDGPPRGFLDGFSADRPVVVDAVHSMFVNTEAMRIVGIGPATSDPPTGTLVRDERGPTGTLREAATALVTARIPKQTPEEFDRAFRGVLSDVARNGIVSVQELTTLRPPEYFETARTSRWLDTRVRLGMILEAGSDPPSLDAALDRMIAAKQRYCDRWFSAGTVKIYVDGDLGDRTAALERPYADGSDRRGEPLWSQEALDAIAVRLDRAGMQLHFHAVGDRAIRMALDAIERARAVNGARDARHQITHLHVVAPSDVPRFRQLGVIANIQPYFAENIEYNTVRALEVLGEERHSWMFRFRDLAEAGATLAVSTDTPVSPLHPFTTIHAGATRRAIGSNAPPFLEAQRLTVSALIRAYTMGGAYANFLDDVSGSLEVGKLADFVMLDEDVFELDPSDLHRPRIVWTVVEGKERYASGG